MSIITERINRLRELSISYEMAGDSITRELLIEAADTIEMLSEKAKPRGWIPVSERLPYNHEYIKNNGLFNVSDGNRSYSEWFDIYDKQRFGEPTMSGFRVDYAVTAWMSLPEPYKEREDNG